MMKVTPSPKEYGDRYEMGALAGAVKAACGITGATAVLHGVQGCVMEANHLRSGGPVVDGYYMPVIETNLGPTEVVQGKNEELIMRRARAMVGRLGPRAKLLGIFTSCAASIIEDNIRQTAVQLEQELKIPVIALDTAAFLGGLARGAELFYTATFDRFGQDSQPKKGVNLVGPFLTGSNNWPFDTDEMVRLLKAAEVPINHIIYRGITADKLPEITRAKANVLLTYENFSEFEEKAESFGMKNIGHDLPLPIGLHNTEMWLYTLAKEFGDEAKAKAQIQKDLDRIRSITRLNYNATWALTGLYGKHVGIMGPAAFVASLARCLFYDFNMRPVVIGLTAETSEAFTRAKKILEPMAPYLDFEVLENPTFYLYGEKLKELGCDFGIGAKVDRHLVEGLGKPHLSLTGLYYLNNWTFIPWPITGVMGMLNLMGKLWEMVERIMTQPRLWEMLQFQPLPEDAPAQWVPAS